MKELWWYSAVSLEGLTAGWRGCYGLDLHGPVRSPWDWRNIIEILANLTRIISKSVVASHIKEFL